MKSSVCLTMCVGWAAVLAPVIAEATFHDILIDEVYTNADGSVQFVELRALSNNQTNLDITRVVAFNTDGTQSTIAIDILVDFPALNANETVLIATPGFQAVAGFAPDFVMPASSLVPFPSGRVQFQNDAGNFIVDILAYGGAVGGFGQPAANLPSDGLNSLTRIAQGSPRNNSLDFAVCGATPKRNDGTRTTFGALDCNDNGEPDSCEIVRNLVPDVNDNDIPDACEDRGDFNGDAIVDLADYVPVFDCLDGPNGGIRPGCDVQDLSGDETVDLIDLAAFFIAVGTPFP